MKNTHIEHPEDSILTGDLSVLDWFVTSGKLSTKIDGAPAIVWGTNPANGQFFVGTKSVFNKFKIKINHHHSDVDRNHQGKVADILHRCLDCLPFTTGIYQGDFIGFGGTDSFHPNTIRYDFPTEISQEIVVAPHTRYEAVDDLRNAVAFPLDEVFEDTDEVKWVQPEASIVDGFQKISHFNQAVDYARVFASECEFVDETKARKIKKVINTFIRQGAVLDSEALSVFAECDKNLMILWNIVRELKKWFLKACAHDGPRSYIRGQEIDGEGYVFINGSGMFKIIDRTLFSRYNFTMGVQRVS